MSDYENLVMAGRAQLWCWRLEDALAVFDAALRLRPREAAAHYLRGEALFLLRRLDEALAAHQAASVHGIAPDGTIGSAMSGMVPGDFAWMSHMLRGDFESAWRLADADRERRNRAGIGGAGWPRHLRPVWDGSPLDGRHVLVRCYHGLGDTIQFMRYVPLLARRGRSVSVEAQPELLSLLATVSGLARLLPLSPEEDRSAVDLGCDAEIDATELPHAFRTTLATIPEPAPLLVDPAHIAEARRRLETLGGRLKVGVVWASGAWKPERSLALDELAPLADLPGLCLVVLQRGPEYECWRRRGGGPPMRDGLASDDVADTAAAIAALDLVITPDTMIAHLAGTLGVPVWVMLHFTADWRWLLGRSDSPWYPSMRLFRQPAPGDWDSVVGEVAAALARLAEGPTRRPVTPVPAAAAGAAALPRR
ncbi:MAG TPA: hypothetical protein VF007_10235 [Stellaceae bacterium]